MITNQNTNTNSSEKLQQLNMREEASVWTSDVDFWLDRMDSYQLLLNSAIQEPLSAESLKQVDHLQSIVTYYSKELLMNLKSRLFHHHEQLSTDTAPERDELKEKHTALHEEIQSTETAIKGYSKEFSQLKQASLHAKTGDLRYVHRVLVPTDFSQDAQRATDYILSLLGAGVEEVLLLHISAGPSALAERDTSLEAPSSVAEQFSAELDRLSLAFPKLKSKLKTQHMSGSLTEMVLQASDAQESDLIVMGTRGRSGIAKALIGTNTSRMLRAISRPLLVVPHEAPLLAPAHVMLALDLELKQRPHKFEVLKAIGEFYKAELDILHIEAPETHLASVHDKVHEQNVLNTLGLIEANIEHVSATDIKAAINEQVAARSVDLLCVIEHEHGWLYHALGKSISTSMVLDTHVPMLILREGKEV